MLEAKESEAIHPLWLYDRSRVTTDWTCPRKRYWNYHFGGKGLAPQGVALPLFLGIVLHDALSGIARGLGIDDLVTAAKAQITETLIVEGVEKEVQFAQEQAALMEGMLRGFYRYTWPQLLAKYPDILLIEEELTYKHNGLTFMSKPDLVLGNSQTGDIVYVEYKSTSSKKEGWVNSWNTAVQLHSTIRAIKACKDLTVNSVIVQGLYKGYESYGKQSSPFCYAYKKNGQPPFTEDQISYEYRAGFKRYPTWELPGGTKAWVDGMPDEVLVDQFPQTPPIYINESLVDAFFLQRAMREHEIKLALQMLEGAEEEEAINNIMAVSFPQKFDQCIAYFGQSCPYRILCHGQVDDPLSQGFTWREPHHQPELDQWQKEAESAGS